MGSIRTASVKGSEKHFHFWGTLTLSAGLVLSLVAPMYLFVVEGLFPGWAVIGQAVIGLVAFTAVNWVIDPITFFPTLGVAGSYQAWLVGNIPNKLLPATLTAQSAMGAKPGSDKAQMISVNAICGAVVVHVVSMLLVVVVIGDIALRLLPDSVWDSFDYILPAVLGGVLIQLAVSFRSIMPMVFSMALGAILLLVTTFLLPHLESWTLLINVALTICFAVTLQRTTKPANRR